LPALTSPGKPCARRQLMLHPRKPVRTGCKQESRACVADDRLDPSFGSCPPALDSGSCDQRADAEMQEAIYSSRQLCFCSRSPRYFLIPQYQSVPWWWLLSRGPALRCTAARLLLISTAKNTGQNGSLTCDVVVADATVDQGVLRVFASLACPGMQRRSGLCNRFAHLTDTSTIVHGRHRTFLGLSRA
jgi:hypothetical protein